MSGIAGIIHFDGRPVEPGQVEAMTAAMHYRGPDGINHWRRGNVALGQCMLRTTPESLEEKQPLTNEDESLVLVMDGRVDNWEELRRELLGKGAVLRTRADAELVLRAYEVWGDACPDHIVGECVFLVWDARQRRLFGARDAAGTRHFYYHEGKGWFAFASELKGLLALPIVPRRPNACRVLDYLLPEFDRDDVVGTFYEELLRLPAGTAMSIASGGLRTWRWWNPELLGEQRYSSDEECTEAFMAELRVAVKCRLRSIKPVGAMLSGGLDSSTIVGLISKDFRAVMREPLQTFSLVGEVRENCGDWANIRLILGADKWLRPRVLTPSMVDQAWPEIANGISGMDEPCALAYGVPYRMVYEAAAQAGCGVVLDGLAGDLLFYTVPYTLERSLQQRSYGHIRAVWAAYKNHEVPGGTQKILRAIAVNMLPLALRGAARRLRQGRELQYGKYGHLDEAVATQHVSERHRRRARAEASLLPPAWEGAHARVFTGGVLSTAYERYTPMSLAAGVEPRSPYADRRLIELAIRMPDRAKMGAPWYKLPLRKGTLNVLPEAVRWRREIGGHPGWTFYERIKQTIANSPVPRDNDESTAGIWQSLLDGLMSSRPDSLASADRTDCDSAHAGLFLKQWVKQREGIRRD